MEAVVTYEYAAEQEDELTLKVGEVITNVQTAEGGWWEGEIHGRKGMFPENFVKLVTRKEAPPLKKEEKREATQRKSVRELASKFKDGVPMGAAPKKKENKRYCKVMFDYKKENDDELELNSGDIVEFHKQVEEGWWEGTLNGRHGVFPSNFVEMIEEEAPSAPAPAPPSAAAAPSQTSEDSTKVANNTGGNPSSSGDNTIKGKKVIGVGLGNIFGEGPIKLRPTGAGSKKDEQTPPVKEAQKPTKPVEPEPLPAAAKREKQGPPEQAIVRFSYAAEQPDELSLQEGQVIRILDKELEDDGWWKGEVDGREGVFPDNFVELLPAEEAPKPKKPPPPSSAAKTNSHHPKLPEKIPMGDSEEKAKTDVKKAPAPPPIGKKPSSQRFGDAVLPGPKPEPAVALRPAKEEPINNSHANDDSGGFDTLESAGQKLTHLTANRAKGPKKRPPSTEGEKEMDGDDQAKQDNSLTKSQHSTFTTSKDSKHSSNVEPSPVQPIHHHQHHPAAANNSSIHRPSQPPTTTTFNNSSSSSSSSTTAHLQRPHEPSPGLSSSQPSSSQMNKLVEQLQRDVEELKTSCVRKAEYTTLRKEHEHLKAEFETLRTQHAKKLRVLMDEVDEEKKLRLSTQVEIERVKKLMAESNV